MLMNMQYCVFLQRVKNAGGADANKSIKRTQRDQQRLEISVATLSAPELNVLGETGANRRHGVHRWLLLL